MAKSSILRIDHDGRPLCLYRFDAQSGDCEEIQVNKWSSESLLADDLHILVPASWVYHTATQVASRNLELLNKSIPFAIEEELSNDVEDNYFAFRLNEDDSQTVIAIEKLHLNQLNEKIESNKLIVQGIYSEIDWLPSESGMVSIWSDAESALLKLDQNQAMRVVNSQINQLLPVYAQDMQQIICNDSTAIDYPDLPINNELTASTCCRYLLNSKAINLYLDELKVKQSKTSSNSWLGLKVLLGVLVVSWIIIQGIQWYALNQSITEIKQQQKQLFIQNFPDAAPSELVDPFAALQSRLKIKRVQSGKSQNILISAVDKLGKTLAQQQSIKLNGLRLVDEKLELQVMAPNMTVINDFHQELQQYANDFSVNIGVNELGDDNNFKSILTMVPR